MSISVMGVMCSKMYLRQKRKNLNIERNQQRVRVLHQRCLKIGDSYCHIYKIYILELFIHKLCIFGIRCHRRCQRLVNKEFVRRRTEQMKVMCEEGGIQGRKVNYRAEKTAIRSLILAVVPNYNSAAILL